MASIGRGRGWAKTTDENTVLRRPGQPVSPKTCEVDDVVNKIYNLDIDDPSSDGLDETFSSLQNLPNSESTINKLWDLGLEDRCFGIKYIKVVFSKYKVVLGETQKEIRRSVLRDMQACNGRKEELHKENHTSFTNFVWMLGVALDAQPAMSLQKLLSDVMLDCLSLLLDNTSEDDTETVAAQLYLNGMCIKKHVDASAKVPKTSTEADNVTLEDIVNKTRQILVNRNVSARSRALLLLIIDLANQHYQPFSGDLQTFYTTVLEPTHRPENGSSAFHDREFNQELYLYRLLLRETESNKNEVNSESAATQIPKQATPLQTQKVERNDGTTGPVPRAIRGVGASENAKDHRTKKKSPRGHKEKLTDQQVWSAKQNTSGKVWGHDDRFDNDYE